MHASMGVCVLEYPARFFLILPFLCLHIAFCRALKIKMMKQSKNEN